MQSPLKPAASAANSALVHDSDNSAMTQREPARHCRRRRIGLAGIAGQSVLARIRQVHRHGRQYAARQRVRGHQARHDIAVRDRRQRGKFCGKTHQQDHGAIGAEPAVAHDLQLRLRVVGRRQIRRRHRQGHPRAARRSGWRCRRAPTRQRPDRARRRSASRGKASPPTAPINAPTTGNIRCARTKFCGDRAIRMRHRQPRQEGDGGFEIVEPFIHGDVRRIVLACDPLPTTEENRMQFDSLDDIRAFCRDLPAGDRRFAGCRRTPAAKSDQAAGKPRPPRRTRDLAGAMAGPRAIAAARSRHDCRVRRQSRRRRARRVGLSASGHRADGGEFHRRRRGHQPDRQSLPAPNCAWCRSNSSGRRAISPKPRRWIPTSFSARSTPAIALCPRIATCSRSARWESRTPRRRRCCARPCSAAARRAGPAAAPASTMAGWRASARRSRRR